MPAPKKTTASKTAKKPGTKVAVVKTPPDIEAKIVIMRSAGYTLPVIAARTGLSISTVRRIIAKTPPPADDAGLDLVAEARTALRDQYGADDAIASLYASVLSDTLHHVELSREIASEALQMLKATDVKDAALVFRSLAAHATTLKAHVDTIRSIAPLPDLVSELPHFVVTSLTQDDIAELEREQAEKDALFGDADYSDAEQEPDPIMTNS